jgi:hypothetical protein
MRIGELTKLGSVLSDIYGLPWEFALYIPSDSPSWEPGMPVMVLDPEETDNPDSDPQEAVEHGLEYALMISSIQDVVDNLAMQKEISGIDDLTKALKYYYYNDSFVVLG